MITLILLGFALIGVGTCVWKLWAWTHRPVARQLKQAMRKQRIVELEKGAGLEISYPEVDLPTIRIVRNPDGEWFLGDRWRAVGFPDTWNGQHLFSYRCNAATKKACEARARDMLKAMLQAKLEPPTEVRL